MGQVVAKQSHTTYPPAAGRLDEKEQAHGNDISEH